MPRKLAIIFPNASPNTETFIQAHIDRLPFEKTLLYGGWFPYFVQGDRPLVRMPNLVQRGLEKVNRAFSAHSSTDTLRQRKEQALLRFLREQRVDAVLAEYGPTGEAVADACEAAQIPLIVHFHGFDTSHLDTLTTYGQYERLFRKASGLIAVSRHMEHQLTGLGAPQSKVYYNPYGVDLNKFQPNPTGAAEPVFFFVGRFVNKKAPQLLILAFDKVRNVVPKARLILGGDGGHGRVGELYAACKQMVRAMHLSDSVTFRGPLSPAQVSEEMKSAMAYVQHSVTAEDGDSEGLPNAILEACASGLPVISTRHAGIPDVIEDGKNGYLVSEGDIDTMAEKMIELASDPSLARTMGMAAREVIVRNFSMERAIDGLRDIIEKSCNPKLRS